MEQVSLVFVLVKVLIHFSMFKRYTKRILKLYCHIRYLNILLNTMYTIPSKIFILLVQTLYALCQLNLLHPFLGEEEVRGDYVQMIEI